MESVMIAFDGRASRRWMIVLEAAALAIAILMAFGPSLWGQDRDYRRDSSSRIAVLENRSDAIDRHVDNTDSIQQKLTARVDAMGNELSEIEGEERIAGGLLAALLGGSLFLQVKGKRS